LLKRKASTEVIPKKITAAKGTRPAVKKLTMPRKKVIAAITSAACPNLKSFCDWSLILMVKWITASKNKPTEKIPNALWAEISIILCNENERVELLISFSM
jgi:hypothetical protein